MIHISFSGDLCSCNSNNTVAVSNEFASFIKSADYRFFCCEAPIIIENKCTPFIKEGPTLHQKQILSFISDLYTHASLANNHAMDFGVEAITNTKQELKKLQINALGAGVCFEEAYRPAILNKNGVKVAVFCLAESQFGCCRYREEGRGGYAWLLNPEIENWISTTKKDVDAVIVYAHAGLEQSIYPLPEWRYIYRHMIDIGCDLVVASHPHLIQGKEKYKGRFIYYSLGNCFFDNVDTSREWRESMHIKVSITKCGIQNVEEFFTTFTSDTISISDNYSKDEFEDKTDLLKDERYNEYLELVNKEVLKHWYNYYESYFSYPIKSNRYVHPSIKRKLFNKLFEREIKKYYRPSEGMVMLFHNLMVDTHRFAISRAISLLKKTY